MNSFEFAINMELDGEKFYKEQAEINKNNELKFVFDILAQDEENHAIILQNKFKELSYELKDNNTLTKSDNVFKNIVNNKNGIRKIPKQLDLYRAALEKEKESINLYKKLLSVAKDDKEKELYEYLIKQESVHFSILDELVLLISRADEWVESAEFGVREKY